MTNPEHERIRLARTTPLSLNLLVLGGDRIRLRQVPFHYLIFDAASWATRLVQWHLEEALTAQPDFPDIACWFRETASEIEDWLIHRRSVPQHPLLRARLALHPHTVTVRALPAYVDRVMAMGRPVEDELLDVCLLLDDSGGAMYVNEAYRAIHDHTSSEVVDAEMVSSERMAEIVAPYMCYLGGEGSRELATAGGSKCL